jgi:hypothetical protein
MFIHGRIPSCRCLLAAALAPATLGLAAAASPAQTWTPTGRTGSSFVGAGPLSPDLQQITHNYTSLTETHDLIQVSVPATTIPSASDSAQLDAVPSLTGMFLAIIGQSLRGPIPCPSGCSGSVYSNTTQHDQWTFTLTQPACYELRASITLFNDSGLTAGQGFQFLSDSATIVSGTLDATGSQQFSRSGTLPPGTYTVAISGQADGNGAPRSANYSHWVSISLGPPTISTQPASVAACRNGAADFSVAAAGTGLSYQWQLETSPNNWINANNGGLPYNGGTIIASGVTTSQLHLSLNVLPGAPSIRFRCVVSNACATGGVPSDPATLTIGGGCPADFNCSGFLSVQDIFDFLGAWFAGDPRADFNGVGGVTVQDIFDYLGAWFTGC